MTPFLIKEAQRQATDAWRIAWWARVPHSQINPGRFGGTLNWYH